MYSERVTMKGLGASQQDVLLGTSVLTTLFPGSADTINKLVTSMYPAQTAQTPAQAAQTKAESGSGITTEKVMIYGGIVLAAVTVALLLARRR